MSDATIPGTVIAPAAPAAGDQGEGYFRQLAESLPQMVFITDAAGNVEYYNRRWYEYTGLPAGTFRADDWLDAIRPDDREHVLARGKAARLNGGAFEAEYRLRRHDGTYRWHLGRSTPLFDAQGNLRKGISAATDITAQKDAAEQLRSYALLVESIPDAVITTDPDGVIRGWNPGATRLYGWQPVEAIGRRAADLLRAAFPAAEDGGLGQYEGEFAPHRKDGTPILVAETLTQMRDAHGNPLGIAAVTREVTAQRHLEENLRFLADASAALGSSLDYRATLTTVAQLGVPRIADWCAVDMLGENGAIGRLAVAHVDPAKVAWALELQEQYPPDPGAPTGVPRVLRTGEAEFYPVITDEMLAAATTDEAMLDLIRRIGFSAVIIVPLQVRERTIGALTFVSAESGRHYSVADLAFAEEVARRAALAVENARLYTAAQAAIALRDEFMALASHELKTPVTSLKTYTQVLQRQARRRGDEQTAAQLDRMDRQIDKLTGLINDLLNVARIQGGRLEYADEAGDLNAVVREAVDATQPSTAKHRIEVTGAIGCPVRGDRERLEQVITNLLTNAVKYSPQADRVVVTLGTKERQAVVAVRDFGIGIAPEHLPHLFDRFYRVSDPAEKTYPGLGIGLYIVGEIVKRHGGAIRVESAPGAGITFTVTLPLTREPVAS